MKHFAYVLLWLAAATLVFAFTRTDTADLPGPLSLTAILIVLGVGLLINERIK